MPINKYRGIIKIENQYFTTNTITTDSGKNGA